MKFRMNLKNSSWRSLKTRVTIFTLAIFLMGIWSLAFYASRMLREDMQRLLGEQQFSTASLIASQVNGELDDRLRALEIVAASIAPAMLGNTAAVQSFLELRTVLQSVFNGGTFVTRLDGIATASIPLSAERAGVNYMDRDYIAAAAKDGKATIGRPVMGRKVPAPIVGMAVPIRDAQGLVIGVLAGVTDLGKPNFLDKIMANRYGKTGGYLLVAPQHRLIVSATDKSRVMEVLPAPGVNPTIDRFIHGYEGSDVLVNPIGVEVLASAMGVPDAGWYMVALLPTEEAFTPVRAMQQRMLIVTMFLTLLAGVLIWWMLKRQLSPMLVAARTLVARSDANQPPQPLPITSQDEIGQLIGGFNRSLETLGQREESLKKSELRFRNFFEKNSSVMLLIEPSSGEIKDANPAAAAYYGYPTQRLVGMNISDINTLPPERIAEERQKALREARNYFLFSHRLASGEVRDVEVYSTPIESGGLPLLFSIVHDITARKEALTELQASEAWFRNIFENANTGIASTDSRGRLTSFNEAFRALLGYEAQALGRMHLAEFTHPDDLKLEVGFFDEIVARRREHYHMTKRYIASDGRILWVDLFVTVIRNAQGEAANFVGIITDITTHKQAEAELRIAASAFESQEGMMITDANSVILRVNSAFTQTTGYTAEEAVGQTPRLLQSGRHDPNFYRAMWEAIHATGGWQGEVWDRRKNGEVHPKWLSISAVKGEDGKVTHYIGMHHDITERKKAEERINELAYFDQLTGLPNRTLLLDRLDQAMKTSGRSDRHCALLFIDLDNFKTLNDTLGHDMGDLLLKQVAHRLTLCVREGDTVTRLGGDEFMVILTNLSTSDTDAANDTETVTEKILAALKQIYQLGSVYHHSTASIGVTLFKDNVATIDDLMKQTDLAMYRAKAAGRNAFRFFDPAMERAVKERAALEDDLRRSLEAKQFLLHYQAQVAGDGRVTGAEVLLRWPHPQRGLVSPAEFIPLAEESGLILPLGHWVLETACTQLALWSVWPEMAHLTVAVNVSARQFRHPGFVDEVLAVLRNTGANPHRLKLELTESLLVENVQEIIEKMFLLKSQGVGFSLDDFGTGYSSLSYLKRLPLDQLKIDQSFVRDVLTDPNDAAIAKTIVALAQSLGLDVIAEGVETEGQRDFLAGHGCHAYQGYLFSRPLPLEDFEAFVKRV